MVLAVLRKAEARNAKQIGVLLKYKEPKKAITKYVDKEDDLFNNKILILFFFQNPIKTY